MSFGIQIPSSWAQDKSFCCVKVETVSDDDAPAAVSEDDAPAVVSDDDAPAAVSEDDDPLSTRRYFPALLYATQASHLMLFLRSS